MYGRRLIPETLREDIDSQKIMGYIDSFAFDSCDLIENAMNPFIQKWLKVFKFSNGCIDPNYESKKLGEGRFGVVRSRQLRAPRTENVSIKFQVAMKEGKSLNNNETKKWRTCWKEACLLLYVTGHPNILQCYGFSIRSGEESSESKLLIATELATHGSLKEVLKKTPSLSITMMWIEQILQGLVHLHKLGIKHGDLKPDNILVFNGLVLKISDFGSGRNDESYLGQNSTTHAGTWYYMAPEILLGHPSTTTTDMWSFAIIVYELFANSCDRINFSEIGNETKCVLFNNAVCSSSISADLKVMLEGMMRSGFQQDKTNPDTFGRDTSSQALEKLSNWFNNRLDDSSSSYRELIMKNLNQEVKEFETILKLPNSVHLVK